MKCNKSKSWILRREQSNARHKIKVGQDRLESTPAGRDLDVLVGSRLDVSQQSALAAKRAKPSWGTSDTASPASQQR